jgi:thioesterase domain-containing protein
MEIVPEERTTTLPAEPQRMSPVGGQDVFVMPATPSQMRFWWLQHVRQGNRALNMPLAWMCKGRFDQDAAAAAMSNLVERHESLRTTFEVVNGEVSQVIHPPSRVPLPMEDLQQLPEGERKKRAEQLIHDEARIRMDMEKGPLFFARVICMERSEHILLLTIHHSVCDGWSNGVLLRDFAAIYDGLMRKTQPALPELPIQFGDYAVWLDEWRKGPEPAESLDYWRKSIGGNFTPLRITRDFQAQQNDGDGEFETLLIPMDLVQKAKEFCATRGITIYMLLLSVYAAMLNRITKQGDLLIGTPSANRRPGTEDLIGPFSNPQVARFRVADTERFGTLLDEARDWTLGAVSHQDLPFEDLNEDEFFAREENQISMQVYFIYQKAFMQAQHTPLLDIVPIRSVSPGTMFDLMLSIVERAEGPRLQLEFNPSFFRVSTIQSILRLYIRILQQALDDPATELRSLPCLDSCREQSPRAEQKHASAHEAAAGGVRPIRDAEKDSTEATPAEQSHLAPRDLLELHVADIWSTALGRKNLSIRENFFDLGGRSLAAMRIVSRINRMYPVDFGLATLFTGNTIERMAELIRNRLSANTTSSLVPMQPQGAAAPLFIIHGAGGNIVRFYQLAMLIGTDHPIYGIQAQSLLPGQAALLRMEDQAAYYLAEIRKIQPKGPYFFLGYSFGGTTALEIAHQLRASGERVALLGMLDSREKSCFALMHQQDSVKTRLDRRIARFLGNLRDLSFTERATYLWEKFYTRTLRNTYIATMAMGFRRVPSFLKSTEDVSWVSAMNYRPKPWPGRITLFRATVQPDPRLPRDLGWTPFAEDGVEVYELPGDHDLVFREPNIQVLAEQVRIHLERSDATLSSVPARSA